MKRTKEKRRRKKRRLNNRRKIEGGGGERDRTAEKEKRITIRRNEKRMGRTEQRSKW